MTPRRIRTLVVDDSAIVRRVVCDMLARDPEIEVVGTATDPYVARDKILELKPDVITLDIEMPRMDGITFLKLLMKHRPMPVVVMSSLSTEGSEKAIEALRCGAVEVLDKPNGSFSAHTDGRLARKIKAAATARLAAIPREPIEPAPRPHVEPVRPTRSVAARQLILIGSSTGGTEALATILPALPADLPGICIVQHIPAKFSLAFANRMNRLSRMEVREAAQGDRLTPGVCLIAPGGFHVLLKWTGNAYSVSLSEGPMVHHQRPAVDVLFDSAVKAGAAPHSLGVVLTGMGADGAAGLLMLKNGGAETIAQNEETSVVFGMPREAIRLGGAKHVLGLPQIAGAIENYFHPGAAGRAQAHLHAAHHGG